jgi:hypothetical protein
LKAAAVQLGRLKVHPAKLLTSPYDVTGRTHVRRLLLFGRRLDEKEAGGGRRSVSSPRAWTVGLGLKELRPSLSRILSLFTDEKLSNGNFLISGGAGGSDGHKREPGETSIPEPVPPQGAALRGPSGRLQEGNESPLLYCLFSPDRAHPPRLSDIANGALRNALCALLHCLKVQRLAGLGAPVCGRRSDF